MDEGKGRENLIQELRVLRDRLTQYDSQSKIDANRYQIMAENAPLMIFAHREKFVYVNKTAALFSSFTKEELYSMNFWDIIHPDFKDIVKARGFKHLKGERVPSYYEIKILTKSGEERWLACASKHVDDFKGAPAVISSAIDITDKKKAESELKTQKNYFKSLFDNSPSAIALLDCEDRILQINKSFHELFKYSFEEAKGKDIKDFIDPLHLKEKELSFSQKLLQGEILRYDTVMLGSDRSQIDVHVSGGPIIEDGKIIGVFALCDDIRTRKNFEIKLKNSFRKLTAFLAGTVSALSETIGKRDPFTAEHQIRVAQLAVSIGKEKSFSNDHLKILKIASALHDIGKIHIPAEILNKPLGLSGYEMAIIRNHAQVGYDILKSVDFPGPVAKIVFQHHERIDGSGYPLGSKGKDIILESRILAVADVVEAMSSRRPYRSAFSRDITLNEIMKHRGTLFDPEIVDICVNLFDKGFKFRKGSLFEEELC